MGVAAASAKAAHPAPHHPVPHHPAPHPYGYTPAPAPAPYGYSPAPVHHPVPHHDPYAPAPYGHPAPHHPAPHHPPPAEYPDPLCAKDNPKTWCLEDPEYPTYEIQKAIEYHYDSVQQMYKDVLANTDNSVDRLKEIVEETYL